MMVLRRQLRKFSLFAMFAIGGLALAPTLSHAWAFMQGDQSVLAEICTPQGVGVVVLDEAAADPGVPASGLHHLEHCPYCAPDASALAPPPSATADVPVAPAGAVTPPRVLHGPRGPFEWASAQPRAPPTS